MWPIGVKDHGIGYLTGGGGGTAIKPAELGIQRRGECDGAGNGNRTRMTRCLLKVHYGNQEDRMIFRIDVVAGRTNVAASLPVAADIRERE